MIPIGDANPTRRTPFVVWSIIAINVVVFGYELLLPVRQLDRLFLTYGVVPNRILPALANPGQVADLAWVSLITSQFLHAGWAHIIGNMLYLWVFGDNIEDTLGHLTFLFFYLASGVLAALAQVIVQGPSNIPSIGASGAIAGVLGAYIVLFPFARVNALIPLFIFLTTIRLPALVLIGWWFVQQFFYGIFTLSNMDVGGIAFWAHIGGFVAGLVMILPFIGRSRRRRIRSYYDTMFD